MRDGRAGREVVLLCVSLLDDDCHADVLWVPRALVHVVLLVPGVVLVSGWLFGRDLVIF